MNITKKQLKKLIREIFDAEREDFLDVRSKASSRQEKSKLSPRRITPSDARVHGLQSADQVKADRGHMSAYQMKFDRAGFTQGINSGEFTVLHDIGYASRQATGVGARGGFNLMNWMDNYSSGGKNTLSTIMIPENIEDIEAQGLGATYSKARDKIEAWGEKNKGIDPRANVGTAAGVLTLDNFAGMLKGASLGVVLKGYPVYVGMEDLGSQTITSLPDRLIQHQAQSGVSKRPNPDASVIYTSDELREIGAADELLIDNWKVVGLWVNLSDRVFSDVEEKFEEYTANPKLLGLGTRTAYDAIATGKKYGIPVYNL
jgi:hypothetical protein